MPYIQESHSERLTTQKYMFRYLLIVYHIKDTSLPQTSMQSTTPHHENPPLRKILLFHKPRFSETSKNLCEWALNNYLQPSGDHVTIVSIIKIPRAYYPAPEGLWSFGLEGYGNNVRYMFDYIEYSEYMKNEEDTARKILEEISYKLRSKNITCNITIRRGDGKKALLSACDSVKPDIILIGSSSKRRKSKFNCFSENRSASRFVMNNPWGIPVITNDNERIERKEVVGDDEDEFLDGRSRRGSSEDTRSLNTTIANEKRSSKNNLASQRFIVNTSFKKKNEPPEPRPK
ncbi:1668_t:CDS:2, partial [Acaulospora colombiana]